MRAIIIGAGRGSRLMPTTANQPKCFARVQDQRILDWSLHAFAENGIDDICFIGGYQIDRVREDYPHFTFRHNEDWKNNNILLSLMHAEDLMDEPFICCYSDILFTPNLIAAVTRVHRGMDAADAHGEYTGIAKFSSTGASLLTEHFNRCREQYAGKPFREAKVFEKSYKILLFQEMLEAGVAMHHTDTAGEYIEIDTQEDFELAQTQWKG